MRTQISADNADNYSINPVFLSGDDAVYWILDTRYWIYILIKFLFYPASSNPYLVSF